MSPSTTIKPSVTARPEKIFVQNSGTGNSANESSVSNDEPEYLVPIGDGADLDENDFLETVNDCVSSLNSAERFPSLVISSDSFTETDDEGHDGSSAKNVTPSPKKKKKVRKPGFIRNLLFSSKTNLLEEKVTQVFRIRQYPTCDFP
uniref:Uncharacterized protein n=1 Tax=Daphnia galeata TaxID=27404 RepID=A0A8J2W5N0_9CRUS|nr:unnamed protein product [Daphnia galeata]